MVQPQTTDPGTWVNSDCGSCSDDPDAIDQPRGGHGYPGVDVRDPHLGTSRRHSTRATCRRCRQGRISKEPVTPVITAYLTSVNAFENGNLGAALYGYAPGQAQLEAEALLYATSAWRHLELRSHPSAAVLDQAGIRIFGRDHWFAATALHAESPTTEE